ncbi:MAG: type II secretion system protein GspM [Candidatus Binataceae bacterium]
MAREWLNRLAAKAAELSGRLRARASAAIAPLADRIAEQTRPYTARARAWYRTLEPRERQMVRILGIVAALFLAYNLIYLPIVDFSSNLEIEIVQRQGDLREMRRMAAAYTRMKSELTSAERDTIPKASNFSLFSVLETSLSTSIGKDKIGSITPGSDQKLKDGFIEYSVELKLQDVSLPQLVDALYGINTLKQPIGVQSIRIQRRLRDPHTYDIELTCVALAKNG